MSLQDRALQFWATPSGNTVLPDGTFSSSDIAEVAAAVQGTLIYDTVAEAMYGVTLSPADADAIQERTSTGLVARANALDAQPVGHARSPERRVAGRCHTYTRLAVSFLRAAGVPARARCGFATYFDPAQHEDHWVAEYWDREAGWKMVDAQLDDTWQSAVEYTGDPFDLTDEEFVTAGHAWRAWRRGELDAERCGLSALGMHGSFWIAANLRLDLAALNKVEMLPWDVWGEGWEPGEDPDGDQLALFDSVADMTIDPHANFEALRSMYENNDRLRMDGTIFNAVLNQVETVN